jgi:hypothetical protein
MWKIHENRLKKGLGATQTSTNVYPHHKQDSNFSINGGLSFTLDMFTHGHQRKQYIDNPFLRWNENLD